MLSTFSSTVFLTGLASVLAVLSPLSASASPVLTQLETTEVSAPLEARAAECARYVLIETRGTYEPQAISPQFWNMSSYTLGNITGGIEYQTVYPALSNGTHQLGADDIVRRIEEGLANCPAQKYALIGYSQGATATAITLANYTDVNSAGFKAIAAVVVLGNPAKLANMAADVDQNGGTTTKKTNGVYYQSVPALPAAWYSSGKVLDICYQNDLVCNGLNLWSILNVFLNHIAYQYSRKTQDLGAAHLTKLLQKALV